MQFLKIFTILLITIGIYFTVPPSSSAREIVLYNFERDLQGWEIPDWSYEKTDHVAQELCISEFNVSEGKYSLEIKVNFTGGPKWQGAYVERVMDITDWSPFKFFSIDIFLPKDAPRGLRARIILTVSEEWTWTEQNKTVHLTPGEWTVIRVDLTGESHDWRKFIDDEFRGDVKKLGVRVESNGKINYRGPIYIDNVKLSD